MEGNVDSGAWDGQSGATALTMNRLPLLMFSGTTLIGLLTMKYLIEGADKETGDDRKIIISAESAAEAENKANAMGILVSNVQARESDSEQPIALGYASLKVPQRATPASSPPGVPEYLVRKPIKLFVAGWVLIIVALLGFGGAMSQR